MAGRYNIDLFKSTYTDPNLFSNNRSSSSIPYGTKLISTYYPGLTTVSGVEGLQEYKDFTNYVLSVLKNEEGTTDEDRLAVRNYLNWADEITKSKGSLQINIGRFINDLGQFTDLYGDGSGDDIETARSLFANRRTGKFGYYHLTPELYSELPAVPAEELPLVTNKEPAEELPSNPYKKYILPELNTPLKSKYPGWSDWIPILAKNTADKIAAIKNYNLEKLVLYPLRQASYRDSLVTNNYAQRLELERQKSLLLSRVSLMDGSDPTQNLKNRLAIEDLILKVNSLLAQLLTEEFNRTSKERLDNINWNKNEATKTANYNISALKAKFNHLLLAKLEKIAKLNNIFDTTIGDLYTNYGEYLKTKRANEAFKAKRLASYDYSTALNKSFTEYLDFAKNPYSWDKMKNFALDIIADASYLFTPEENAILLANTKNRELNLRDPLVKRIILKAFNSNNPIAAKYLALFKEAADSKYKDLEVLRLILLRLMNAKLLGLDEYITNQWGPNLFALKRPSVLSSKKGSKLDRLTKALEIFQRELLSVRENSHKRNALLLKSLEQELGYINLKTLMMLKSVFQ